MVKHFLEELLTSSKDIIIKHGGGSEENSGNMAKQEEFLRGFRGSGGVSPS